MRELAAILARIDISIAQSRIPDPADRAFLLFQDAHTLFYFLIRSFFLRELAELYFHKAALSRFLDEVGIVAR